jgi:hypothetical protein
MAARVDENNTLSPTSATPYQPLGDGRHQRSTSRPRSLSRTASGRSISFRNPRAILTRDEIIRSASTMKVSYLSIYLHSLQC